MVFFIYDWRFISRIFATFLSPAEGERRLPACGNIGKMSGRGDKLAPSTHFSGFYKFI